MNRNIFLLIGMPGCGKTTIGKETSQKLNMKFYDMDEYIENIAGKTIPELFEISEEHFRDYETKACMELSKLEDLTVISTGGGVIKRKENMDYFRENGIIIFIDRPVENIISDIDSSNRPLLKGDIAKLYKLYSERYNLYNEYSHYKVINDDKLESIINNVIDLITNLEVVI